MIKAFITLSILIAIIISYIIAHILLIEDEDFNKIDFEKMTDNIILSIMMIISAFILGGALF